MDQFGQHFCNSELLFLPKFTNTVCVISLLMYTSVFTDELEIVVPD